MGESAFDVEIPRITKVENGEIRSFQLQPWNPSQEMVIMAHLAFQRSYFIFAR